MAESTTVLIVDDSPVIRLTLERFLQQAGVAKGEIHVAEDGKDAIDRFHQVEPNVVFMDMMMPDLDGAQAASLMLQDDPTLKVIIVTGLPRDDDRVRDLISLGAFDIIEKPIRANDVRNVLALVREETEGSGRIR